MTKLIEELGRIGRKAFAKLIFVHNRDIGKTQYVQNFADFFSGSPYKNSVHLLYVYILRLECPSFVLYD